MFDPHKIIIVSGPSGAGEDSVIEGLSQRVPINRVITATTRAKRPGESDGRPYHFISREAFEDHIAKGEMIEWAKHYNDNYYGVTAAELARVASLPGIGVWKIDYQGVKAAKEKFPGLKAVLIRAPLKDMERRLRARDGTDEAYLQSRMAYSKEWLRHTDLYDHIIDNPDGKLDEAVDALYNYLVSEGYITD